MRQVISTLGLALLLAAIPEWTSLAAAGGQRVVLSVAGYVGSACSAHQISNNLYFDNMPANASNDSFGYGVFLINCSQGANPVVSLGNGSNYDGGHRRLSNGSNFVPYTVRHPSAPSFDTCSNVNVIWTDSNPLDLSPLFASSGGEKLIRICVYAHAPSFGDSYIQGSYYDAIQVSTTY